MTGAGTSSPAVVAVGGGHGLAATLRAAASYAGSLTAVVSVADDGGSSGRLRDEGLPAMGDLRRCITELGAPGNVWALALEHRFEGGDLDGHAVGNVLIAALAAELGDFSAALDHVATLVGARGRVLPATTSFVDLVAATAEGERRGQVAVQRSHGVERVWLDPADPPVHPEVVAAVDAADQILLGPGSLYTSVLAALAVPALRAAVVASGARRVYVCNLAVTEPETAGYDVAAHVAALERHGVDVDVVVCHPGGLPLGEVRAKVVEAEVAGPDGCAHDPALLGPVLSSLM